MNGRKKWSNKRDNAYAQLSRVCISMKKIAGMLFLRNIKIYRGKTAHLYHRSSEEIWKLDFLTQWMKNLKEFNI